MEKLKFKNLSVFIIMLIPISLLLICLFLIKTINTNKINNTIFATIDSGEGGKNANWSYNSK